MKIKRLTLFEKKKIKQIIFAIILQYKYKYRFFETSHYNDESHNSQNTTYKTGTISMMVYSHAYGTIAAMIVPAPYRLATEICDVMIDAVEMRDSIQV